MKFDLTTILIVIILGLLLYLAFKPDGNGKYIDAIEQQNRDMERSKKELIQFIEAKFDSLKLIERKETIIKNYYNDIYENIPVFANYSIADSILRMWLNSLGAARFNK